MMKNAKKLIWFLFLNAVVSAATVIVAMNFWMQANPCYSVDDQAFEELKDSVLGDIPGMEEPQDQNAPGYSSENVSGLFEITSVIGAGDLETEFVVIRYIGEDPVSMQGWMLKNDSGLEFIFPNVRLLNNTDMKVNSREGTNSVNGLFWGAQEAVWGAGEAITLYDPAGQVQAVYNIP